MPLRPILDHLSGAGWFHDLKTAGRAFLVRSDITFAASLAFCTSLSFAPMVMLMLAVTGAWSAELRSGFVEQTTSLLGPEAGSALDVVMKNSALDASGFSWSTVLSIALVVFSATVVFSQVQATLNKIWEVQVKAGVHLSAWIRKRLLSFGMLVALGFLLGVSLALNAIFDAALPAKTNLFGLADAAVSAVVFTAMFTLMYWLLPDAKVQLTSVWRGALIAALCLTAAKRGIGLYLARSTAATAYGAASAIVLLQVWAFIAALLFYFGAELARARTLRLRDDLPPPESDLAEPAKPSELETVSRTEST